MSADTAGARSVESHQLLDLDHVDQQKAITVREWHAARARLRLEQRMLKFNGRNGLLCLENKSILACKLSYLGLEVL